MRILYQVFLKKNICNFHPLYRDVILIQRKSWVLSEENNSVGFIISLFGYWYYRWTSILSCNSMNIWIPRTLSKLTFLYLQVKLQQKPENSFRESSGFMSFSLEPKVSKNQNISRLCQKCTEWINIFLGEKCPTCSKCFKILFLCYAVPFNGSQVSDVFILPRRLITL